MSRTIDPTVQALLDTPEDGTEIVVVLEVFWTKRTDTAIQPFPPPADATERIWYADRPIPNYPEIKSNILELGNVDAAVQVSQGGQSKSLAVTLDDTNPDGELKQLFDTNDVHKTPVRVWFYVMGTDFATKKFPIFLGQINTPVVWDEGKRTFSFSIVNRIEDAEVGFSAEEGEFPELPEELIGKTWPLCFGTVTNIPALKAVPTLSGILANGVGIRDFTLGSRLTLAEAITCPRTPIGFKCSGSQGLASTMQCNIAFEDDQNCLQSRCIEIELLRLQIAEQAGFEYGQITIFSGEKMPQGWNTGTPVTGGPGTGVPVRATGQGSTGRLNRLTLNIQGGLFTGYFDGTPETPSQVFVIESRQHPRFDPSTGTVLVDPVGTVIESKCPADQFAGQDSDSDFTDTFSGPVWTGLRSSRISWEAFRNAKAADFFWAPGGATVTIEDVREIIYVANILPSTVHSVKAKRFLNGNEFLLSVPTEFYEVRQTDYVGYQMMEVVFQRPLSVESKETGGGWSDEIYVTMTSSVGPNTVDIIEWFINTYTTFAIDAASFNDVRTKLDNYPMHFPLLRRPNLLSILQDLSRKARCALWQVNDTFFIKYLAEEPTPVATITYDDIIKDNPDESGRTLFKMDLTKTEDLITKQTAKWRKDYSPFILKDNTLILRHNVIRYGTHSNEEDYFPYVHLDIVRKSATFHLIRSANTWKKIKISTSLAYTLLEPFDAVTLRLNDLARDDDGNTVDVIGVIEKAILDSKGKRINLEIWTPVRSGELLPYDFAFPAGISESALYPTLEARNAGEAGSGTEPNFSTIAPPGHPLRVDHGTIFSGLSLGCNGAGVTSLKPGECRQDHGDRKPSDIDDKKPNVDVNTDDQTSDVGGGSSPISNGAGYGTGSSQWLNNDRTNKAEGDGGRGREVAEQGGTGDSPSSGDNSDTVEQPLDQEFLDDLPDADEVEAPYKCVVTVAAFDTTESGGICGPIPATIRIEKYAYDSTEAATTLCGNLSGRSSCSGVPPCNTCVSSCTVSCTGDPADAGDGSLIGFSTNNSGTDAVILGG